MTNLKPFNLDDALAGKLVVTQDGRKVKSIHLIENTNHEFPLVVCVENGFYDFIYLLRKDGTDISCSKNNDLFMVPTKKKLWIAISKQINTIGSHETTNAYPDKKEFINVSDRFHIIEIEIEE